MDAPSAVQPTIALSKSDPNLFKQLLRLLHIVQHQFCYLPLFNQVTDVQFHHVYLYLNIGKPSNWNKLRSELVSQLEGLFQLKVAT